MNFTEYFEEDNGFFLVGEIRKGPEPWSALEDIGGMAEKFAQGQREYAPANVASYLSYEVTGGEEAVTVHSSIKLDNEYCIPEANIYIGPGCFLEHGAIIKRDCLIMPGCEIRQGAYLRGGVILGERCVVGHATEVKNSIFMDGAHAGHFNYVGDSILGSKVNLGAGTKLANLQFRTKGEIDTGNIKEISITHEGKTTPTGRQKFGAVIGDYSEIGCNTVTSPGAIIGAHTWIYPNTTLPKGFYPPYSIIRGETTYKVITSERPAS